LILSQAPGDWEEIYAALDQAGIPDDFISEGAQDFSKQREEL